MHEPGTPRDRVPLLAYARSVQSLLDGASNDPAHVPERRGLPVQSLAAAESLVDLAPGFLCVVLQSSSLLVRHGRMWLHLSAAINHMFSCVLVNRPSAELRVSHEFLPGIVQSVADQ